MKLTEQQLAEFFRTSTQDKQNTVTAVDCLAATPASATRLAHSENILNDYEAAQGMKMAFGFKKWSEAVADSVQAAQKPWFNLFGLKSPLKTAVATMAFAFALVIVMPEFKQDQAIVVPQQIDYANDVIQSIPFEGQNNVEDVLTSGSFDSADKSNDNLFNASFG